MFNFFHKKQRDVFDGGLFSELVSETPIQVINVQGEDLGSISKQVVKSQDGNIINYDIGYDSMALWSLDTVKADSDTSLIPLFNGTTIALVPTRLAVAHQVNYTLPINVVVKNPNGVALYTEVYQQTISFDESQNVLQIAIDPVSLTHNILFEGSDIVASYELTKIIKASLTKDDDIKAIIQFQRTVNVEVVIDGGISTELRHIDAPISVTGDESASIQVSLARFSNTKLFDLLATQDWTMPKSYQLVDVVKPDSVTDPINVTIEFDYSLYKKDTLALLKDYQANTNEDANAVIVTDQQIQAFLVKMYYDDLIAEKAVKKAKRAAKKSKTHKTKSTLKTSK